MTFESLLCFFFSWTRGTSEILWRVVNTDSIRFCERMLCVVIFVVVGGGGGGGVVDCTKKRMGCSSLLLDTLSSHLHQEVVVLR